MASVPNPHISISPHVSCEAQELSFRSVLHTDTFPWSCHVTSTEYHFLSIPSPCCGPSFFLDQPRSLCSLDIQDLILGDNMAYQILSSQGFNSGPPYGHAVRFQVGFSRTVMYLYCFLTDSQISHKNCSKLLSDTPTPSLAPYLRHNLTVGLLKSLRSTGWDFFVSLLLTQSLSALSFLLPLCQRKK